jgi:hypothetical protein
MAKQITVVEINDSRLAKSILDVVKGMPDVQALQSSRFKLSRRNVCQTAPTSSSSMTRPRKIYHNLLACGLLEPPSLSSLRTGAPKKSSR